MSSLAAPIYIWGCEGIVTMFAPDDPSIVLTMFLNIFFHILVCDLNYVSVISNTDFRLLLKMTYCLDY